VTAPVEARRVSFAGAPLEHAFYFGMALVLLALLAAGFSPTFYARDVSAMGPLPSPVLVHGLAGTAWVVLFATQVALVATRRVAWHRRAGWVAAVVTVVFVVSGALVTAALERSHGTEPLTWRAPHVFTNGAPLTLFALLVAAGISQRSRPARHKRLMLLAAVVLAPPAIGRIRAARPRGAQPRRVCGARVCERRRRLANAAARDRRRRRWHSSRSMQ
jgi:MFS family permease